MEDSKLTKPAERQDMPQPSLRRRITLSKHQLKLDIDTRTPSLTFVVFMNLPLDDDHNDQFNKQFFRLESDDQYIGDSTGIENISGTFWQKYEKK